MNTALANAVVVWVLLYAFVPASGPAYPGSQDPQSSAPQQEAPATTTPGQAASAPTQDCAKSKDTCELPPESQPQSPSAPIEKQSTSSTPPSLTKSTATDESKAPTKSSKKKKHRRKKTAGSVSGPRKVVVRDGGTSDPEVQLSPSVPREQSSRQTTDQLLVSAQNNLKTVSTRTLNASQQATVEQIKMFIEQANSALKDGDVQRGHNLATKAHLLSDDLAKH